MKRLLVGLHVFGHDSSIAIYDIVTEKTIYYKFERLTGIKHMNVFSFVSWLEVDIKYLGYTADDILEICVAEPVIKPWLCSSTDLIKKMLEGFNTCTLNHHLAHQYSNNLEKGIVYDASGNDFENLSIYGEKNNSLKITKDIHPSMGVVYVNAYKTSNFSHVGYLETGMLEGLLNEVDFPGKVMAWEAYGDYLPDWHEKNKNLTLRNSWDWSKIENMDLSFYKEDTFKKYATYIKNITAKYTEETIKLCKTFFLKEEKFSFSGGVAQNLIMNNHLKSQFPNLEILPHVGDEGLSLGCLYYLLKKRNMGDRIVLDNFPFCQSDEDMGYATSSTIKKAAEYLANGKIVLWCQGHGEIGPRALGHRSILMNPLVTDAKEQVNQKVKKREWYRPYAASVKFDKYKQYFNLDWESPYMLYQANVIDKQKFKSICHADGTCRIQTVYPKQKTYYNLLDEFEKLTGVPVLLNTSCNLPGSPIVGSKKQAVKMFDNCKADYLIIGDTIHERKHND